MTLPYKKEFFSKQIEDSIRNCQDHFGKENVAILSNSAGSKDDKEYKEAGLIEELLGIPVVLHIMKKPAVWEDLVLHFGNNELEGSQIVLVGDRILSDVVMGNKYGMLTFRVQPFTTQGENFMVKILRVFEDSVLPKMIPLKCREKSKEHK